MAWHELIVGSEPMADAMLDARQEGDSYRRIEVITGSAVGDGGRPKLAPAARH
jgi:hypothetical protein